jgi:FKBP-type peptidyl-prolyl cis-trans isomerase 2
MIIKEDSKVKIHYVCHVDEKVEDQEHPSRKIYESTYAIDKPFEFKMNDEKVYKVFRENLIGKKLNDVVVIELKPEQAYGYPKKNSIFRIPKSDIPENLKVEEGTIIRGKTKEGKDITSRIIEVADDTYLVDLNHPLAGKNVKYTLEILEIN